MGFLRAQRVTVVRVLEGVRPWRAVQPALADRGFSQTHYAGRDWAVGWRRVWYRAVEGVQLLRPGETSLGRASAT
ncbi:MAG: hypothetical protein C4289_07585 [Chloroflexota bacterium]